MSDESPTTNEEPLEETTERLSTQSTGTEVGLRDDDTAGGIRFLQCEGPFGRVGARLVFAFSQLQTYVTARRKDIPYNRAVYSAMTHAIVKDVVREVDIGEDRDDHATIRVLIRRDCEGEKSVFSALDASSIDSPIRIFLGAALVTGDQTIQERDGVSFSTTVERASETIYWIDGAESLLTERTDRALASG